MSVERAKQYHLEAQKCPDLVRFPASWNQLAEKESHQINNLEQILVAKVFNFCGICSSGAYL